MEEIDYEYYRPTIVGNEWIVTETDLCAHALVLSDSYHSFPYVCFLAVFIMEGCGVLGTVR